MIFSSRGTERPETAEKLKELGESAGLLDDITKLREERRILEERLAIAESFSGASAELFRQFNDYLSSVAYISLTAEAKAVWYPAFQDAISQLLGEDSASEVDRIIDTSTFAELLEYMAEANPIIQSTVTMLTDEIFQKSRVDAQDRVVKRHILKAENDAILQAPALIDQMDREYMESPEGQKVYSEAFQRKLGELALSDPEELAERIRHQAYADAIQAHLDSEAARMRRELLIETAREDFFKKGINLSRLPIDTEVTIWLGTDKEFSELHKESTDGADPAMIYYRKIRAFRINDSFEGFDVHEDVIDTYPASEDDEDDDYDVRFESFSDFSKRVANERKQKKKAKKAAVIYDDTTNLEGRHLLGLSKKGYTDSGHRLERFIVAGKPLGYDGDPRDHEHKATTLVVLNVALNGEPVVDFKQDVAYSKRDELKPAKSRRGFFGW